jgi:hypothetical protein
MGLDLWFREDVVRILASTHETMRNSMAAPLPLDAAVADSYRHGFDDALRFVAVAFGICVPGSDAAHGQGLVPRVQLVAGFGRPEEGSVTVSGTANGGGRGQP